VNARQMVRSTIFMAAIMLPLAASSLSGSERLRAGQWEYTTSHPGQTETASFKHCITAAEAAGINGDLRTARAYAEKAAGADCKVTDYKVDGNSVSHTVVCGPVSVRSSATFTGTTSEGDLVTKREGRPEAVTHIKGKRLGDCP
jgi:hypothetical protein